MTYKKKSTKGRNINDDLFDNGDECGDNSCKKSTSMVFEESKLKSTISKVH
jgi:hypothetical protein